MGKLQAPIPDISANTQPTFTRNAGNDRDGLGVHMRQYVYLWEILR